MVTMACRGCGREAEATGGMGGLPPGWHHVVIQHYRRISQWIDRVSATYCPQCWALPGNIIATLVREAQADQARQGAPPLP